MKTLPTIHRYGTSASKLCDDYLHAADALWHALRSLEDIDVNARDYYPQGPDAWASAINEMQAHIKAVTDAKEAMLAVAKHLQDYLNT